MVTFGVKISGMIMVYLNAQGSMYIIYIYINIKEILTSMFFQYYDRS